VSEPTPSRRCGDPTSHAPTGFVSNGNFVNDTKPVGAWLAREEAVRVTAITESKLFSISPITFEFSFGT
jgi:hypothetical protein